MSLVDSYRSLGPVGFASYAGLRVARRLPGVSYRRYLLVAVPTAGLPAMPRGYGWRELGRGEIPLRPLELTGATVDFRLRQGMTCLAVYRGEQLVGVNWLGEGPFDEDELHVRFAPPPGAAWDTGMYLLPSERGGRGFAALWAASGEWLRARGLDWSMSRITDYNHGSWNAHRRLGARPLGSLVALTVHNRQLTFGVRPMLTRLDGGPRAVVALPDPGAVA